MDKSQKIDISDVSLEDLGIMIKKGFDEVGEQFREVYAKFDEVDSRFDDVDKRFTGIEKRLSKVEDDVSDIKDDMATKGDISRLETRIDGLEKTVFTNYGNRLRKVEAKLRLA